MSGRPERGPPPSLRDALRRSAGLERRLWGAASELRLVELAWRRRVAAPENALEGRSVLLRVNDPLNAAIALVDLDGLARRIVLCPPDLTTEHLPQVIKDSEAELVVADSPELAAPGLAFAPILAMARSAPLGGDEISTEWAMFTSGTSGPPKLAVHTFGGLTGAIGAPDPNAETPVWGTFYDIRRYGGLQILLRALVGGGSMVISRPDEPPAALIERLARHGATHITGTPSQWRRALMSPRCGELSPRYLRLSGEIADQAVLDLLKARFPGVPVGHAFASTEAGVCFEVTDGLAGFPVSYVEHEGGPVEMKLEHDSLRVRSARTALRYLGERASQLRGDDGFVDTGDLIERRGERLHFVGRCSGVINVGGLKVHPEEVEAALNAHPAVRMSRARARKNPITGAIVTAEVVIADGVDPRPGLKSEILAHCRTTLASHKAPALISFVQALPISGGGKLERSVA